MNNSCKTITRHNQSFIHNINPMRWLKQWNYLGMRYLWSCLPGVRNYRTRFLFSRYICHRNSTSAQNSLPQRKCSWKVTYGGYQNAPPSNVASHSNTFIARYYPLLLIFGLYSLTVLSRPAKSRRQHFMSFRFTWFGPAFPRSALPCPTRPFSFLP